jgi:hypothetical protein
MNLYALIFWVEIRPKYEDENLSEKFSAQKRLIKIGPWIGLLVDLQVSAKQPVEVQLEAALHEVPAVPGISEVGARTTRNPGVDVMITFFCDFSPIFGEKIGVFLKNQCYDQFFFQNLALF